MGQNVPDRTRPGSLEIDGPAHLERPWRAGAPTLASSGSQRWHGLGRGGLPHVRHGDLQNALAGRYIHAAGDASRHGDARLSSPTSPSMRTYRLRRARMTPDAARLHTSSGMPNLSQRARGGPQLPQSSAVQRVPPASEQPAPVPPTSPSISAQCLVRDSEPLTPVPFVALRVCPVT